MDAKIWLTDSNTSAFLGSEVQTMPKLGRDCIEAVDADIASRSRS